MTTIGFVCARKKMAQTMVKRSVRVIMNVITNILRARQYERKKDATKKTRNELTEIEKRAAVCKEGNCSYFTAMKRKIWVSGH